MITVYHGSTQAVKQPIVNFGRTNLDFGPGFYVTRLREQAVNWAYRVKLQKRLSQAWLNTYEFDMDSAIAAGHQIRNFESYNLDWLNFITDSRKGGTPWQGYDIIEGGVANDKVIDTVEAYLTGFFTAEEALGRLAHAEPNNQIALLCQPLTDRFLHHISSELIITEGGAL